MKEEICLILVGIFVVSGHIILSGSVCVPGECEADIGLSCVYPSAPCHRGKCQCQPNYSMSDQAGTCMPDKQFGQACDVTDQCEKSYKNDKQLKTLLFSKKYNFAKFLNVVCEDKICVCKSGFKELSGSFLKQGLCTKMKFIGEECSSDSQCLGYDPISGFANRDYVYCDQLSKLCNCRTGSFVSKLSCISDTHAKAVGDKCTVHADCEDVVNSQCNIISHLCVCITGYFKRNQTYCDKPSRFDDPCSGSMPCAYQYSGCFNARCGCQIGYSRRGQHTCYVNANIGNGELCSPGLNNNSNTCRDPNYQCGYCPGDGRRRCVQSGGNSLQTKLFLSFLMAVILLYYPKIL